MEKAKGGMRALVPRKVEDTPSLRRARVANRAEDIRGARQVKSIGQVAALSCAEVERERQVLEKVLLRVRTSTGYMDKDMQNQRTQLQKNQFSLFCVSFAQD